ncbi:hypothetical protein GCM10010347_45940 [Streptomyces cirratus]|uniref:Uncharacterized protein n=1 Tax=Streptomyces cirratus TaxID=68187 RepID=A0ABQ3F3U3_9ACTN|nr:hypothetical protein GCM10010347_45940 [Streptomyces cirratus]
MTSRPAAVARRPSAGRLGTVVADFHTQAVHAVPQDQFPGASGMQTGVGDDLRDQQEHVLHRLGVTAPLPVRERLPGEVAAAGDDAGRRTAQDQPPRLLGHRASRLRAYVPARPSPRALLRAAPTPARGNQSRYSFMHRFPTTTGTSQNLAGFFRATEVHFRSAVGRLAGAGRPERFPPPCGNLPAAPAAGGRR